MVVADAAGRFFNGLGDYGVGCILGFCMYLCIVIITCTGIIVTKLNRNTHYDGESDQQSEWKIPVCRHSHKAGASFKMFPPYVYSYLSFSCCTFHSANPRCPSSLSKNACIFGNRARTRVCDFFFSMLSLSMGKHKCSDIKLVGGPYRVSLKDLKRFVDDTLYFRLFLCSPK